MNIQEIKALCGINGTLALVRQFNEAKEAQPWVSHWDDAKRVRVTMHDEVHEKLKQDKSFAGLALKPAKVVTPKGKAPYTRFVVICPLHIEGTY